jgi:dihydrodipicolinate synthase/N-acetylneuraminate lyase
VAGVKYGCDLNGYFGGAARLPRVGLTAEERARVETALGEVRS